MGAKLFESAKKRSLGLLLLLSVLLGAVVILSVRNHTEQGLIFASQQSQADPNKGGKEKSAEKKKAAEKKKHSHPSFGERQNERQEMVRTQIAARGIRDANTLAAMRSVPRHKFVRGGDLRRAYSDQPLPIGLGQTISQPYIVAYMTEALMLDANDRVLEVGTGSGYQAAVCAEIAAEVYTIEILEGLAASAKKRLAELGYANVFVRAGDGYFGWEENGPFDAIIITAAAGMVPPPLVEQLKPDGLMILPLGSPYGAQTLVLVSKDDRGRVKSKALLPVRFVPMVGRVQKGK